MLRGLGHSFKSDLEVTSKFPVFGQFANYQLSATGRYVLVGSFVMFLDLYDGSLVILKWSTGRILQVFTVAQIGRI